MLGKFDGFYTTEDTQFHNYLIKIVFYKLISTDIPLPFVGTTSIPACMGYMKTARMYKQN